MACQDACGGSKAVFSLGGLLLPGGAAPHAERFGRKGKIFKVRREGQGFLAGVRDEEAIEP
ncbi:MAG: hypothetical protein AB1426_12580 [Bacillota bacterium]